MNFNILFLKLRSPFDEKQKEIVENPDGDVWMQNTPEKHGFTREMLEQAFINKSWHKAIFHREPLERFVSAYRSKCEGRNPDGLYWCTKQFGANHTEFAEAVRSLGRLPLENDYDHDPPYDNHFQRQMSFCGGLNQTLQYYDTVELLDSRNSHEKVAKLLKTVGASSNNIDNFQELFPSKTYSLVGKRRRVAATGGINGTEEKHNEIEQKHNTNTKSALASYFVGENASLVQILVDHYREDYNVFQMKIPGWAQRLMRQSRPRAHDGTTNTSTMDNDNTSSAPPQNASEPIPHWPLDGVVEASRE